MHAAAPLIITLYGITAAILWGGADYLGANASKRNNPNAATLGVSLLGTLVFTVIFIFNHGSEPWNLAGVIYSIAAGISLELGLLLFYRGLEAGPVNLVSPISSAYPLISLLIILVIFGGTVKRLEIFGIVLVVVGIAFASGLLNFKKSDRKLSKGIIYALLTVGMWGLAYALVGKAVSSLGWQKATLVDFYAGLVILPIALTMLVGKRFWPDFKTNILKDKYVLSAAISQSLGGTIFNIGVSHTTSSAVITAISASYPAMTIFLALKVLKEKAKTLSLIGAFITILGIVILSL